MSQPPSPRHVLHANQFDRAFVNQLFDRARWMDEQNRARRLGTIELARDRLMCSLFYEASTRTRFSFETAAHRLGMRVVGSENAGEFSSRSKGETDLDAFRVLAGYRPDVILTRHDRTAELAQIAVMLQAEGYPVPIVNAGDGGGQHPTQSLLDLYTIRAELGRLDNLHVVMVGDLKNGRTVRSLSYLLALYPHNRVTFVAPPELQMLPDVRAYLRQHRVDTVDSADLAAVLPSADIVYVTRIQAERGMDQAAYDAVAGKFRVTPAGLDLMPPHARVMHPLPRVETGSKQKVKLAAGITEVTLVNELDPACDASPKAAYFRQAANGLPIRMALLEWVVN